MKNEDIDRLAADLATTARGADTETKLQIMDRLLKLRAIKFKEQQGAMGSGFGEDGDET